MYKNYHNQPNRKKNKQNRFRLIDFGENLSLCIERKEVGVSQKRIIIPAFLYHHTVQ